MTRPDSLARGFLILIDKPGGLTSHDVVERARRATGVPRIGHSGTLDPMATGLLLLCAGGAARLQGFFTLLDKSYEGTIRLGLATATYDREGEPLGPEKDASGIGAAEIEASASPFRGEFLQSPPPYSAKKVKGRKFYEMARRGEEVPVLPKKVRVSELVLSPPAGGRIQFSISCSSGTYIRSIAHAIGQSLGCGAHLESLRRTRIGDFRVQEAVALELFESLPAGERLSPPHALPLSRVPFPFERLRLASLEAWKVRKGQSIPARGVASADGSWVTLLGPGDEMVALAQVSPIGQGGVSILKPRIVLAEEAGGGTR
ncbi:MAG: tRNA pseudouridine(55) synthase TruB [Acidobacteria bacterium]|nr:tRNA pseudouridine(55) synthase TruB [Acidobacteriota bacterium]MCA1610545.1 tRNA pseudouridine(55) synthase TruB [Acidobacteriota bacterium]